MTKYVKMLSDGQIEYANMQVMEFDATLLRWVRRDKTEAELRAEGYKPLLVGTTTTEGDWQVFEYREEENAIYKDMVAMYQTEEQKQEYYDNLSMPRDVFLENLLIASAMRPDLTDGALLTKDLLRQAVMATPIEGAFTPLAQQMSLIWLDDMPEMVRGHEFVAGTLTNIGFQNASINKFFETRKPEDLIVGWVKPELIL